MYGSVPLLQVWPKESVWLASSMSLTRSPVTVTDTVASCVHREPAVTFRSKPRRGSVSS